MRNVLFAVSLIGVVSLSSLMDTRPPSGKSMYYLPRPDTAASLCGTFSAITSDVFYLIAVQLTGEQEVFLTDYPRIIRTLEIAQFIDARSEMVNFLGGVVIPKTASEVACSIRFLERAHIANPDSWRIPYWIGMDYLSMLGDYENALSYFKEASRQRDAPSFLVSNQAMLYYKSGKAGKGALFLRNLERTLAIKGETREWIKKKALWLERIAMLQESAGRFKDTFGRPITTLSELKVKGFIRDIPADPFGRGYYWDTESGLVKSRFTRRSEMPAGSSSRECPACFQ